MSSVVEALGFGRALADTVEKLSSRNLATILVRGPSGSGKTTFCYDVANKLASRGFKPVFLRGDAGRVSQDYYPFFALLRSRAWLHDAKEFLHAAADEVPLGKGLIKRAIDLIASYSARLSAPMAPIVHDPIAAEIITALRGRLRRSGVLLVLDDVHSFDPSTLGFLALLITPPTASLDPVSRSLAIIASANTEETTIHPNPHLDRFLAPFEAVDLTRCTEDTLPAVLVALGLHISPDKARLTQLLRSSGGHLRVLAELAAYIAASPWTEDLYTQSNPSSTVPEVKYL